MFFKSQSGGEWKSMTHRFLKWKKGRSVRRFNRLPKSSLLLRETWPDIRRNRAHPQESGSVVMRLVPVARQAAVERLVILVIENFVFRSELPYFLSHLVRFNSPLGGAAPIEFGTWNVVIL